MKYLSEGPGTPKSIAKYGPCVGTAQQGFILGSISDCILVHFKTLPTTDRYISVYILRIALKYIKQFVHGNIRVPYSAI